MTASFYSALASRVPGLDVNSPEVRVDIPPLNQPAAQFRRTGRGGADRLDRRVPPGDDRQRVCWSLGAAINVVASATARRSPAAAERASVGATVAEPG